MPHILAHRAFFNISSTTAELDPQMRHTQNNFEKGKGYDISEITYGKLSTRRIQIYRGYFFVIYF